MRRIAARRWLIPDVAASIARLHATFDCTTGPIERTESGALTAPILCAHPRSARVDLVQPAPGSVEAALVAAHGPLPWAIVIEVADLDAKAADLDGRGTEFATIVDDITARPALSPAPVQTANVPFLFIGSV
jgi:hypothetical protein